MVMGRKRFNSFGLTHVVSFTFIAVALPGVVGGGEGDCM
jgi:hypothetical protein